MTRPTTADEAWGLFNSRLFNHGKEETMRNSFNIALAELFSPPAPVDRADVTYVVWSNEHKCWWGPNRAGYYSRLEDAGRYTRDEALKICVNARGGREFNSNPSEVPLPLDDAERFWPDDKEEWRIARHKHENPELWEDEE